MRTKTAASVIVDFYEVKGAIITCFCYKPNDETEEKEIQLDEFEEWLNGEGYLSRCDEDEKHPDARCQSKRTLWTLSIHAFMDREHNWSVEDLLTQFINKIG